MITTGRSLKPLAGRFRKKILKKNKESIWNLIQTNFDELDKNWNSIG